MGVPEWSLLIVSTSRLRNTLFETQKSYGKLNDQISTLNLRLASGPKALIVTRLCQLHLVVGPNFQSIDFILLFMSVTTVFIIHQF
jgi:hypothetical protein